MLVKILKMTNASDEELLEIAKKQN